MAKKSAKGNQGKLDKRKANKGKEGTQAKADAATQSAPSGPIVRDITSNDLCVIPKEIISGIRELLMGTIRPETAEQVFAAVQDIETLARDFDSMAVLKEDKK